MRTPIKICITFSTAIGIAMLVVGAVMLAVFFPKMVEEKIDESLVLRNGSHALCGFEKPPVPTYSNFFFFNVTNKDEVNAKGSQANLQEVGPYVYREELEREIVKWDEEAGTVSYFEIRKYYFEPDLTNGSLEDIVNHVNVASIGFLGSKKIDMLGFLVHNNKTVLSEETPGPLVESHTIDELIFKGFDISHHLPPLQESNLKTVCAFANNCTFGFYFNKNGTKSEQFEVKTGDKALVWNTTVYDIKKTMKHYREIASYDDHEELTYWHGKSCNSLNGTDGTQFPPEVDTGKGLYVFSTEVCRSLYLTHEKDVRVRDIPAARYVIPPSVFESSDINPDNACFCKENSTNPCPSKSGVLGVAGCHDGYPVVASAPHFYMAAQEYRDKFRGLNPQKEKHETYIDVEPMSGVVVSAAKRIQISMRIEPNSNVKWLKFINETTIFPVFWAEERGEIDRKNADLLENQLLIPYKTGKWSIIAVIIVGSLLLFLAMVFFVASICAPTTGKIHSNLRQEIEKNSQWNYKSTLEDNQGSKDVHGHINPKEVTTAKRS